jgi:hypothetical protein
MDFMASSNLLPVAGCRLSPLTGNGELGTGNGFNPQSAIRNPQLS